MPTTPSPRPQLRLGRPHLTAAGQAGPTGAGRPAEAAVPADLQALTLDPLTVEDDADFLPALAREKNLPAFLALSAKRSFLSVLWPRANRQVQTDLCTMPSTGSSRPQGWTSVRKIVWIRYVSIWSCGKE